MKKNWKHKAYAIASALTVGAMMMGGVGQAFAKTNVVKHSVKHASGPVVHLQETGSTLLWPLFQLWVPVYKHVNSKVDLTTAGTGSGVGISQASDGTVQIGASDAYMSNRLLSQHPGMLNIPMAISAQQIMYNIPGVKKGVHLHLTGNVIAQIYLGKIRYWNAPQIQSLNKGVKLPHWMIVPIHRTDGSGDTFLFTQFMTDTNAAWSNSVQYGTSVSWPAIKGALGANGNNGVVALASKTPGSIAYVGISWLNNGLNAGLGEAALQNRAGRYLLPNPGTIAAAANMMIGKTPADERTSLIYAPGANSYPIINYEYAIINEKQANPATATAVKNLLLWAISPQGGNKAVFMDKVHFLPLPASIAPLSRKQIAKIHG